MVYIEQIMEINLNFNDTYNIKYVSKFFDLLIVKLS